METLEIQKKNAIAAYNSGDAATKKLLEDLFGEKNLSQKITDRVKTFDDAVQVVGEPSQNIGLLLAYNGNEPDMLAAVAFMKLTIIAKALNEGWQPDWTDSNQYKYYPWFKYKSGFGLSCDVYDIWITNTTVGSRLCFKTAELAKYAGEQFADLYNDFLTIK